ncbi:hypothetical protein, partial [Campylobacter jejuni]|uniref:hypothetical protein n=1 Tax=Campylobacter jejuni TaxID=197 RepID=UPI001E415757
PAHLLINGGVFNKFALRLIGLKVKPPNKELHFKKSLRFCSVLSPYIYVTKSNCDYSTNNNFIQLKLRL